MISGYTRFNNELITVITGKWIRCRCRFQSHLCSSRICVLRSIARVLKTSRNFVEFDVYSLYGNFIRSRFLNRRIADWNLILVAATTTSSFFRGTQRQFSENICSKDDLRSFSRDFRTSKKRYNCPFFTEFYPKKNT